MPTLRLRNVALLFIFAISGIAARADSLLFDLSTGLQSVSLNGTGLGQGVFVNTSTTIDGMAFYLSNIAGYPNTFKYMIWDGTNANLLYSQAISGPDPVDGAGWVETSTPFSFTLISGHEYYFGVMGTLGNSTASILPAISYSNKNLVADDANSVYLNFDNPTFAGYGGTGNAQVALRLYGTQSAAPEPSSFSLLGIGLAGTIGIARRRLGR